MNVEQLRELQAPIKSRYRDEPEAAVITLRAKGEIGQENLACRVETGRALVEAGLHPASGGSGLQACSGDMLLEALAACAGVTLSAVATALGIDVRQGTVSVEGDLDFRGTLGVAKDAPVGFRAIRLALRARHRCQRGAAGEPAQADRALLRRLADAARAGRVQGGSTPGRLRSGRWRASPPAHPWCPIPISPRCAACCAAFSSR